MHSSIAAIVWEMATAAGTPTLQQARVTAFSFLPLWSSNV